MWGEWVWSEKTAANEHENVSRRKNKRQGTKDQIHRSRISMLQHQSTGHGYPKGNEGNSNRQRNQKRTLIENARFSALASGGKPRCCHQIESQNAHESIQDMVFDEP